MRTLQVYGNPAQNGLALIVQVAHRWIGDAEYITAASEPPIPGSADPAFLGDPGRWNPEQLLLASISQCHMLWYLHLAADAGIVVVDYGR